MSNKRKSSSDEESKVCALGDSVPDVEVHYGFPPEKVNIKERIGDQKVLLISLPGAFTPTWSGVQIPGYIEHTDKLIQAGVDEVIVFCVNDGAVMKAWAKDQGIEKAKGMITFMADPAGTLTKALGIEMIHPGPEGVGIIGRGKRTAIFFDDGEAKIVSIAEKADDPAGDSFPDVTLAPAMLEAINKL